METIIIVYNANPNLPQERAHLTKHNCVEVRTRRFEDVIEASNFWLECSFYNNAITTLDEILKYCPEQIDYILKEPHVESEEILLGDEIYNIEDEKIE